ncbi:hypothetical protein SLEP1_g18852 [Rubroshorea leprosula]|uniref:Uncharacterized protein n=1 Tax=Rubroshorea leprosula TaxID=152421 RepID=A0AAV5IYV7_9ROSI|nr:hypothetical protein SLEP1_g18852 [Rubroshorea leprosula]
MAVASKSAEARDWSAECRSVGSVQQQGRRRSGGRARCRR